jgi:membrane associated rhomboid family serine protease
MLGMPLPGMNRTPVVTWTLLGANAIIWLASVVVGTAENPGMLVDIGALFGPLIAEGQYWRLFTAMFLHAGPVHLALNSFALFIFGQMVERAYGHLRYLTIYLLAGLAGSVASYLFNSITIGVGASGAILGVLGALTAFFVAERRVFGEMGRRNLTGLLVLAGINLFYGLATPGIDNWAHIGGFAAGFFLGLALAPRYRTAGYPFGGPSQMADSGPPARRLWVVPVVAGIVIAGAWLGTRTLPENAYSHFYVAERQFQKQDYSSALDETEEAIGLAQSMPLDYLSMRAVAEAHLLRGQIFLELGDAPRARAELALVIRMGEPETRSKAIALLVALQQ